VKTDTPRGQKIARSYFLPPYQPHLKDWVEAQSEFLESLSARELYTLLSYSYRGDVLVNRYLRNQGSDIGDFMRTIAGSDAVPFMYQIYDNYEKLARMGAKLPPKKSLNFLEYNKYPDIVADNLALFTDSKVVMLMSKGFFEDLMRIFLKAPRLPHPIVTYRGFKSESHVKTSEFRTIDFQSTSLNPYAALSFTQKLDSTTMRSNSGELVNAESSSANIHGQMYCCIYEITVEPSVPCIYMEEITRVAGEYELLLPPSIDMELGTSIDIRTIIRPPRVARPRSAPVEERTEETPRPPPGGKLTAPFKPPAYFGKPLTEEQKKEVYLKYMKLTKKTTPKPRVSVISATATSRWFPGEGKKKKAVALANNSSNRFKTTAKSRREENSTRRAYRKRIYERAKTKRVRERRVSTRRNRGTNNVYAPVYEAVGNNNDNNNNNNNNASNE
jgi:hypothetical protein